MYEKLLEPGTIGRMNLRNRIVMSPTETHFTASDGMLTWPEIDYYARRAKGGVGLIITQQTQACAQLDPIDPYPRSARLDDDAYIPMMSELTEAVHLQGAKIAVLLTPGGGAQAMGSPYETGRSGIDEPMNVGPGEIRCPVDGRLSPADIIAMDWLVDNVVGGFPAIDELKDEARALVELQGIREIEMPSPSAFSWKAEELQGDARKN